MRAVRRAAPRVLRTLPAPAATLALALALAAALVALPPRAGAEEGEAGFKEISGLLADPNPEVRTTAAFSLARYPREQAAPLLIALAEKETSVDVNLACVEVLTAFREEKAIPTLLRLFNRKVAADGMVIGAAGDLDGRIRDTEEQLRKAKEPEKQNKLREELKNLTKQKDLRREAQYRLQVLFLVAMDGLGKIRAKEAIPRFLELAVSENPAVRYAALAALVAINDASVRPGLQKFLSGNNPDQRLRALYALTDLEVLERATRDDAWVQRALVRMLAADIENSDRSVAATALGWAMDLGGGEVPALNLLPRIQGYRDLLRSSDADNRFLVDYELLTLYLRHRAVRRALSPPLPARPAGAGTPVETR